MKTYDLIIIGAGPAGLTAALYAARYKLDTLVIGKLMGGLIGETYEICNFPSHEKILGSELAKKMLFQIKALDVNIKPEEVLEIKKSKIFEVITKKNRYFAKKIILAIGSERKRLQLLGEKKFMGKGLSYCATCDASFYKNKIVGIVGGSNAAFSSAFLLSQYAKKIYIIYRKGKFSRVEPIWIEKLKENKKINLLLNSQVTKLFGKDKLNQIEINGQKKLKINGLFVEIGSVPNLEIADKLKLDTEKGYIKVKKNQETNIKGLFAAGDITDNPMKQIITACGEGAIAANSVYKELVK